MSAPSRIPLEVKHWGIHITWTPVAEATIYEIQFRGGGGGEDGNAPTTETYHTTRSFLQPPLTGEDGETLSRDAGPTQYGGRHTWSYNGYTGMSSQNPSAAGWYWRVRGKNNFGDGPWTNWTSAGFSPISPAQASAEPAQYSTNADMQINWSGSDNINEVEIQRSTNQNSGFETIETFSSGFLASPAGSGFRESGSYTDTGVALNSSYFYNIITTNSSGYTGSALVSGTVGSGYQAPHAISGLTASSAGAGSGQINLNWTSPGYTGIGYTIEIYSGSGSTPDYALQAELTGSDAQGGLYGHTGLTSGVTYFYKARAKDSSTTSGPYTSVVSGTAE